MTRPRFKPRSNSSTLAPILDTILLRRDWLWQVTGLSMSNPMLQSLSLGSSLMVSAPFHQERNENIHLWKNICAVKMKRNEEEILEAFCFWNPKLEFQLAAQLQDLPSK